MLKAYNESIYIQIYWCSDFPWRYEAEAFFFLFHVLKFGTECQKMQICNTDFFIHITTLI